MDDELIRLLKTNPEKGLEKLMSTYMGFVYTIVFNKLNSICSQEDIEECVSTVFYEAFQCRNNIDLAKGSIKSFLGVLAKRKAIDRFRQHIRHTNKDVALDESFYASQSSGIDHETKAMLIDSIKMLREPDKEIFIRKYYLGQSTKIISKILGIKENTIDKKVSRGLLKLKNILKGVL